MSTTKSVASDASFFASSSVSDFVFKIIRVLPLSSLGSFTDDQGSQQQPPPPQQQQATTMFDPYETSTIHHHHHHHSGNNHNDNCNDTSNHHNGNNHSNHSHFVRNTSSCSSQTVVTEKDSAWFYTDNERSAMTSGMAMDDGVEMELEFPTEEMDDGSTLREEDDDPSMLLFPHTGTSQKYRKVHRNRNGIRRHGYSKTRHHHYRKRKQKQKQRITCDTTTIWLVVLCIGLIAMLGILGALLHPFRNNENANANANASNGVAAKSNTNGQPTNVPAAAPPPIAETSNMNNVSVPTTTPSATITLTTQPTMYPTTNPTMNPTTNPTAMPIPIATARPTAVASENSVPPSTTSNNNNINNNNIANINKTEDGYIPPLSMGPLVGHTTHDSVTLWAYHEFFADYNYTMEILIYDDSTSDSDSDSDSNEVLLRKIPLVAPRADRNHAIVHTVWGLQPAKFYKYGMHIFGERVGKGSFTTAPLPRSGNSSNDNNDNSNSNGISNGISKGISKGISISGGSQFDYILASCMNHRQYKNQIVWDRIFEIDSLGGKTPDFTILAGDTVYLQEGIDVDVTPRGGVDFDRLWLIHREQRREPHFADFVSRVPTYATWNDHEYGSNDASKDQIGKDRSLRAWEGMWANPGYGDEFTDDGVYYSYYWGDVHYIVTDDHWYRDPSKGNRLGKKQTEWIREELIRSNGIFKVIVIGSDIMERGWSSDLTNIGKIVRQNNIDGVLFHAGDIHRNEFKHKEAGTGGFPYKVAQITSSGIAKVWRRPFVHIRVDTRAQVVDPTMTAFFYGASSEASDEHVAWNNDPALKCSSIVGVDRDKEHSCTETIRLSDLTVPSR